MNIFAYNVYVDSECMSCLYGSHICLSSDVLLVVQGHLVDVASNDYCNILISLALTTLTTFLIVVGLLVGLKF